MVWDHRERYGTGRLCFGVGVRVLYVHGRGHGHVDCDNVMTWIVVKDY